MRGCDSLIHLAYRLPAASEESARLEQEFATNVADTLTLLRAASQAQVAHVCFASTAQVYRACAEPAAEDGPVEPQNAYAVSKLAQEECFRFFSRQTGRHAAILRLTTAYGPGEHVSRAVPNFIRAALSERPLILDGAGDKAFDLVYVDDVARAFAAAVTAQANGTFNIASGVRHTPRQVAERVLALCQRTLPIIEERRRLARGGAACDTRRTAAVLKFRAAVPIDEGLNAEIGWLRNSLRAQTGDQGLTVSL